MTTTTDVLLPGDPAPAFKVGRFLKGAPVERLLRGTVYVIEFWASWCGPCRASIPHLTALQAQYPDVVFIGVGVHDAEQSLENLVAEQGEAMGYRVAIDAPLDSNSKAGWMAKHWLDAAGRNGIPDCVVVDADGRVAWFGLPRSIDDVLAAVTAGTWAADKFRLAHAGEAISNKRRQEAMVRIDELFRAQKWPDVVAYCDQACEETPNLARELIDHRIMALSHVDGAAARDCAVAFLQSLPETIGSLQHFTHLSFTCQNAANVLEEVAKDGVAPHPAVRDLRSIALRSMLRGIAIYDRTKAEQPGALPSFLGGEMPNHAALIQEELGLFADALEMSQRALDAARSAPEALSHLFEPCERRIARCKEKLAAPMPPGGRVVCDGDTCMIVRG